MSLRITRSVDPIEVKTLTVCIYSNPGLGKSTLAFTAESPLLLDFDHGAYRAGNRGDTVQIGSWVDVENITGADLIDYKTLAIDTAGRALDALTADIIARNPKMGRGGGALTLQGYGELKSRFIAWTKLIRSFGLNVVLIAHSDEQRNGDDLITRLDVQGGSKGEIYKAADVMGQIYLSGGKRMLNFSPTDTAFGKNPAQLPPLEVPDFRADGQFLAGIIRRTKDALNAENAAQTTAKTLLSGYKEIIENAKTADDLNVCGKMAQAAEPEVKTQVKKLLTQRAKSMGFTLDKQKGFVAAQNQAA
jgi:hypothetical protein